MNAKQKPHSNDLKALVAGLGGVAFLVGSLLVALYVRQHQLTGEAMPNFKGGFMTFRDGYHLAVFLLLISLVWFTSAWRYCLLSLSSRDHAEGTNDSKAISQK